MAQQSKEPPKNISAALLGPIRNQVTTFGQELDKAVSAIKRLASQTSTQRSKQAPKENSDNLVRQVESMQVDLKKLSDQLNRILKGEVTVEHRGFASADRALFDKLGFKECAFRFDEDVLKAIPPRDPSERYKEHQMCIDELILGDKEQTSRARILNLVFDLLRRPGPRITGTKRKYPKVIVAEEFGVRESNEPALVAEPVPVTFHGSIDYTTFIVGLDAKNGPRGKVLELNRTDDLDYVQNIVQGAACSIEAKRNSEKFKPKHIYEGVAQAVRLAQSLDSGRFVLASDHDYVFGWVDLENKTFWLSEQTLSIQETGYGLSVVMTVLEDWIYFADLPLAACDLIQKNTNGGVVTGKR